MEVTPAKYRQIVAMSVLIDKYITVFLIVINGRRLLPVTTVVFIGCGIIPYAVSVHHFTTVCTTVQYCYDPGVIRYSITVAFCTIRNRWQGEQQFFRVPWTKSNTSQDFLYNHSF